MAVNMFSSGNYGGEQVVPHYVFYFGKRDAEVELPFIREVNYPYQLKEGDIIFVDEKLIREVIGKDCETNEMVVDSLVYFLRDPASESENVCMVYLVPNLP